jgi:hypothetical protein
MSNGSVGISIFNRLSASANLTNIIEDRIYPITVPQNSKLPAVVYQQVTGQRVHAMIRDPGLAYPRYQLTTLSTDYDQNYNIAKYTRQALQDYSGSTGGVTIQRAFFDNEYEFESFDEESKLITYHIVQDYIIWWSTQ